MDSQSCYFSHKLCKTRKKLSRLAFNPTFSSRRTTDDFAVTKLDKSLIRHAGNFFTKKKEQKGKRIAIPSGPQSDLKWKGEFMTTRLLTVFEGCWKKRAKQIPCEFPDHSSKSCILPHREIGWKRIRERILRWLLYRLKFKVCTYVNWTVMRAC